MFGHISSIGKQNLPDWFLSLPGSTSLRFRGSMIAGSLTAIVALSVYLLTLALDITWSHFSSDSGELITAAVTLGVPHPPGYPTYVLLGKLISFVEIGTMAYRFNLFSALSAAIAAGFIGATAFESLQGSKPAWAASLATGISFAFMPLVWSQAVVAEVYALNIAFLAVCLWALLGHRSAVLTGLFLGLSITTHLTSLLMLPMVIILTKSNNRVRLGTGLILGLSPLLLLPILANLGSPVVWGNPSTFRGWLWLITGQIYTANLSLPESGQLIHHLSSWSSIFIAQYAYLGWLLIIIGIVVDKHGTRRIMGLLVTAAAYTLFSFAYNTSDAILFLMPALLLLTPILASGFSRLGYWSLLFPLVLLLLNFNQQNLRDDPQVRPIVEAVINELPQGAMVLTPGDQSLFTLWYLQHVENQRPDLLLVDANLFAFDWYRDRLKTQYPELNGLEEDDLDVFKALNEKNRPFCFISLHSPEFNSCHH
jgi:hypothetical protein